MGWARRGANRELKEIPVDRPDRDQQARYDREQRRSPPPSPRKVESIASASSCRTHFRQLNFTSCQAPAPTITRSGLGRRVIVSGTVSRLTSGPFSRVTR